VAKRIGIRPSAIRYYEQIGILPPVKRISGQRRYDSISLSQLAVIHHARQSGFSLNEIRELFFSFEQGTPAAARWRTLSDRKLVELAAQIAGMRKLQRQLAQLQESCRCHTLEECGEKLLGS
jgi:DNA-binding transcriptional MerR regulator